MICKNGKKNWLSLKKCMKVKSRCDLRITWVYQVDFTCYLGKGAASSGRLRLAREKFPCKFSVLKNYKENLTSFLTKTISGKYIDHLEFTVSRVVIWLFLKNLKRYLNSVCTKIFLGSYPKYKKFFVNIFKNKVRRAKKLSILLHFYIS